jgi:hypothetical protein
MRGLVATVRDKNEGNDVEKDKRAHEPPNPGIRMSSPRGQRRSVALPEKDCRGSNRQRNRLRFHEQPTDALKRAPGCRLLRSLP